jgi:hypothetical protein
MSMADSNRRVGADEAVGVALHINGIDYDAALENGAPSGSR